ncbi:MAG: hypothetical protein RIT45_3459 [Pseudomonadota bacterium]|jgi:hypothetical protein
MHRTPLHGRLGRALAAFACSLALVGVAGCDSDHDHDGHMHSDGTLMTMKNGTSANGLYTISWTTEPATVVVGEVFVVRTSLSDATGSAVTGATLAVDGYMPAHGHGMEGVVPLTAEVTTTAGTYETQGMRFQMPGQWELRFTIEGAPGKDTATLAFGVQ